jgi:hypothetical protein
MGFLAPPNHPKTADASECSYPILLAIRRRIDNSNPYGTGSLISTSPSGLKRKASTQRTSLIGG